MANLHTEFATNWLHQILLQIRKNKKRIILFRINLCEQLGIVFRNLEQSDFAGKVEFEVQRLPSVGKRTPISAEKPSLVKRHTFECMGDRTIAS